MVSPRIAVIDDDRATLDLVAEILGTEGFSVSTAPAVDPGLHEIRDPRPDLVIIDLLLSTDQRWLSGWDAVRLARAHADLHRVPILVISADPARLRIHVAEARQMDRVEMMAKPFGVDDLLGAVRRLLSSTGTQPWDADYPGNRPLTQSTNRPTPALMGEPEA